MLCTGLLQKRLEIRFPSCLRCILLCGGWGSCHTCGRVLTGTTSMKRLVVYFLTPSGHVSWEERCAADAVYKFSRLLNPIETSSVSIGVVLAPAAQTALARRAQRQRMKPVRPFHHSAFNNERKIANISNSTRQTHRQNNVPAFFDYCPLRHSSRQLRPTKSHFMLPRCMGLLSYIRPASTQIINPVPPLTSHAPHALPSALLPPPALHPSPVAALAPFILKLFAHFCARA